uniref:'chromo' domain containing protein n=1 Tax=Solanum tuberosum TaxID=4113 RepID=M1DU98_SOLTU
MPMGKNLGLENFFVVFEFSQSCPDLDEIGVLEIKNKQNESEKRRIKFLRVSSLFRGHLQAATDRPRLGLRRSVIVTSNSRMVNTRFNGVSSVAPINAPVEESAVRGRSRGRGRGKLGVEHEEIEENVDVENVKEIGQEEEVQAGTTCVPPLDPVLAQQIMSFLKGLAGPGVLPSVQATQAPANRPVASTAPKMGGT